VADGLLIYADSVRDPDLFLASGISVGDPFAYVETDGRRVIVTSVLEADAASRHSHATEVWTTDEFGFLELIRGGMDAWTASYETVRGALERLGVARVTVPHSFPVALADRLRGSGVEVTPDRDTFERRRRSKDERALDGIRAAQRATEAAFVRVRELLGSSAPTPDGLVLEGEPLTCERVSEQIVETLREHGCDGEPPLVNPGRQAAFVHESGTGPIHANDAVVVDIFPRHVASRMHADMTRTFCVGEAPDEIRRMHAVVLEALQRSTEAIRAGISGRQPWEVSCDVIEAAGFRTQRSAQPGEVLDEDYFHSLGHGVGIEVHEAPSLGMSGRELVAGDVVSVEPGVYRKAVGGVRLEDLVVVRDGGCEVLTDFPYDLEIRA
jgi:Xaa-Pro aminopeptidase